MLSHDLFKDHFSSLFDDGVCFGEDTIHQTFEFYIKVFSNLRLKDLCGKYNSPLSKTNTVGIRQSLAANRKRNMRTVKSRKREQQPDEEEPTKEEIHLDLLNIAERGLDDNADMAINKDDESNSDYADDESTSTNAD